MAETRRDNLISTCEPGSVQPPAGTTMESVDDVIVPVFRGDIVADGIKWPDGNKWQRR